MIKIMQYIPHFHKWRQRHLFMSKSWLECSVCNMKRYWCGDLEHKEPDDCELCEIDNILLGEKNDSN